MTVKKKDDKVIKVEAVKVEFNEVQLRGFLSYVMNNRSRFEVEIDINEIKITYISKLIDSNIMHYFNNAMIPWDLIYFKSIIFNRNTKTVDLTFDSHSRCQPDVSEKIVKYAFGLFC